LQQIDMLDFFSLYTRDDFLFGILIKKMNLEKHNSHERIYTLH